MTVLLLPIDGPLCAAAGRIVLNNHTRAPTIAIHVPAIAELARRVRLSSSGRSDPRLATVETGHLIGLAITHEIGHALRLPHAATGLMQPRFDLEDVRAVRDSRLGFSPLEAAQLRCTLRQGSATRRPPD
jgi:hypothetical protein